MVITTNPKRSVHDSIEINKGTFIGKPLQNLYHRHHASRKGFVLFLENADGSDRRRLGEDPNLSLLILRNRKYSSYPIAEIFRYYDKISVEESGPRAEETDSGKKEFHPPTLEEVVEYCKERKSPVDPIRFYDFFSEGHWKDSKGNSVRNWKQKLISWERDEKGKGQKKEKPHTFTPTNFD